MVENWRACVRAQILRKNLVRVKLDKSRSKSVYLFDMYERNIL